MMEWLTDFNLVNNGVQYLISVQWNPEHTPFADIAIFDGEYWKNQTNYYDPKNVSAFAEINPYHKWKTFI